MELLELAGIYLHTLTACLRGETISKIFSDTNVGQQISLTMGNVVHTQHTYAFKNYKLVNWSVDQRPADKCVQFVYTYK